MSQCFVCLFLSHTGPRATFGYKARYIGSAISNVSCNGSEDKTSHCSRNETNTNPTCEFAGVICRGMLHVNCLHSLLLNQTLAILTLTLNGVCNGKYFSYNRSECYD